MFHFQKQITAQNCKERWKNIRGCLTRSLKQQSQQQQTFPPNNLKKPYYLMNYLAFVLPFTRSRKYKFSTAQIADIKSENSDASRDSTNGLVLYNYGPENEEKNDEMYYDNEEVIEEDELVETEEKLSSNAEEQQCIEVKTFQENSADWYFLKSLMPDIQSLNAAQKRKLRIQILTLIDNIITEG